METPTKGNSKIQKTSASGVNCGETSGKLGSLKGENRGSETMGGELSNKFPLISISNLDGKAGRGDVVLKLVGFTGPEEISAKNFGPTTFGPDSVTALSSQKGLDKEKMGHQVSMTKPNIFKNSQEVQGRKWTRLDRSAQDFIPHKLK
nr:hypothetical protein CFP56_73257 [Quercus suber]